MLWLRRDLITVPDDLLTIEECLVSCGLAGSVSDARRLLESGAVYLNNQKVIPPGKGFIGCFIGNGELVRVRRDPPEEQDARV